MYLCFMISLNKIADLGIDFGINHRLEDSFNRKDGNIDWSLLPAA